MCNIVVRAWSAEMVAVEAATQAGVRAMAMRALLMPMAVAPAPSGWGSLLHALSRALIESFSRPFEQTDGFPVVCVPCMLALHACLRCLWCPSCGAGLWPDWAPPAVPARLSSANEAGALAVLALWLSGRRSERWTRVPVRSFGFSPLRRCLALSARVGANFSRPPRRADAFL